MLRSIVVALHALHHPVITIIIRYARIISLVTVIVILHVSLHVCLIMAEVDRSRFLIVAWI